MKTQSQEAENTVCAREPKRLDGFPSVERYIWRMAQSAERFKRTKPKRTAYL